MANGARLRTLSRRGSQVQILPPALLPSVPEASLGADHTRDGERSLQEVDAGDLLESEVRRHRPRGLDLCF